MIRHADYSDELIGSLLRTEKIKFGGHAKLRIFGTLRCSSGKRMKRENRVFFADWNEAVAAGYRPCGNCLRKEYRQLKIMNAIVTEMPANLLPFDGEAYFFPSLIKEREAEE